jgi:hypothetical protein
MSEQGPRRPPYSVRGVEIPALSADEAERLGRMIYDAWLWPFWEWEYGGRGWAEESERSRENYRRIADWIAHAIGHPDFAPWLLPKDEREQ